MNVGPAFIADPQPAVAVEPGKRSLHHPTVVAQPLRGLDPPPGDPRGNTPAATDLTPPNSPRMLNTTRA